MKIEGLTLNKKAFAKAIEDGFDAREHKDVAIKEAMDKAITLLQKKLPSMIALETRLVLRFDSKLKFTAVRYYLESIPGIATQAGALPSQMLFVTVDDVAKMTQWAAEE